MDSCETECDDSVEGESGDNWEIEPKTNDSLHSPTPKQQDKACPMDLLTLSQLGKW